MYRGDEETGEPDMMETLSNPPSLTMKSYEQFKQEKHFLRFGEHYRKIKK